MKQHYSTLGLQKGASQEAIQAAFKRLSKELDPANNDNQEFFKEEYKKIQEAYEVLSNSSILSIGKGTKKNVLTSPKAIIEKTTNLKPNKNKITKKIKLVLLVIIGFFAISLVTYIFSRSETEFRQLDGLVYESHSTRWMKSEISNDIIFLKDNMKSFSGKLSKIRNNYDGSFVDGKKNGLHKEYKEEYNGFNDVLVRVREGRFENGTPVGVHKNWYSNGQLQMEVTFSKGKRKGLSKKWSRDGDLLALDFDQNNILDYMVNYLNSSKALNIVEGSYDDYDENEKGYNFSVIKILDRYYAIMTNNFKNIGEQSKTFYIGDVKAIFSSTQETNRYDGRFFMAGKTQEPVKVIYNIIGNYIDFNVYTNERSFKYYKK
ncbi:DnaJ domain-containing protein [Winogradskyella sp.]|nr:DnaJ domain-containing protein [Winogradskyella sp.]